MVILALDNFPIMSFDLEWSLWLLSSVLCSGSVWGLELAVYFLCQFTRSIKMKPTVLFPFQCAVQEGWNCLRILFPNFFSWTWNSVLSKKLVKVSFNLATLCCSLLTSNTILFLFNLTYRVLLEFFSDCGCKMKVLTRCLWILVMNQLPVPAGWHISARV